MDIVYVTVGAESASLYCNFNGYLPASPNVIWRDDEGTILEDSTTDGYNITTTFDGPGRANIGGITVNNGVTSVLTIFDMLQSDIGSEFTCSIEGTNIQGTAIQLILGIYSLIIYLLSTPRIIKSVVKKTYLSLRTRMCF